MVLPVELGQGRRAGLLGCDWTVEQGRFRIARILRGDVWELYLTHRITKRFIFKADYMRYNFDYSQSGWHMGSAKPLDSVPPPILSFPSPKSMDKFLLGLTARF